MKIKTSKLILTTKIMGEVPLMMRARGEVKKSKKGIKAMMMKRVMR